MLDPQLGNTATPVQTLRGMTFRPTFIGWIVFLFGLVLINRTKAGHTIIFYGLILVLIYLLIGNYQRVMSVIVKK